MNHPVISRLDNLTQKYFNGELHLDDAICQICEAFEEFHRSGLHPKFLPEHYLSILNDALDTIAMKIKVHEYLTSQQGLLQF
jgi:hypothetical protein